MSFLQLFAAGKGLVGMKSSQSPYRMRPENLLPKFESTKNPFAPPAKNEPMKIEPPKNEISATPTPAKPIVAPMETYPLFDSELKPAVSVKTSVDTSPAPLKISADARKCVTAREEVSSAKSLQAVSFASLVEASGERLASTLAPPAMEKSGTLADARQRVPTGGDARSSNALAPAAVGEFDAVTHVQPRVASKESITSSKQPANAQPVPAKGITVTEQRMVFVPPAGAQSPGRDGLFRADLVCAAEATPVKSDPSRLKGTQVMAVVAPSAISHAKPTPPEANVGLVDSRPLGLKSGSPTKPVLPAPVSVAPSKRPGGKKSITPESSAPSKDSNNCVAADEGDRLEAGQPATQAEAPAIAKKSNFAGSFLKKLNPLALFRDKKSERRWVRPPVQTELSLDKVKVIRNDLSETDLEVVVPIRSGEKEKIEKPDAAVPRLQRLASASVEAAGLNRLTSRILGTEQVEAQ